MSKKMRREATSAYMFILPYAAFFFVFILFMLIDGIKSSFYDIGFRSMEFVGFENYSKLFQDPIFLRALGNTLIFVTVIVSLTIIAGIWIASTVFDKNPIFVSFVRMGFYIPTIVSMAVMSVVWYFLLSPNGIIPYLGDQIGLGGLNFFGSPLLAKFTIIFVVLCANIGTAVIIYIAAMLGISSEVLEAAVIDGTTRFQRITHIIIPNVSATTAYVLVTNIVAVLRLFVAIQLLTGGGPYYSTTTIMYYLYLNAFKYGEMGIACAVGVIMFIIAFILGIPQVLRSIREK